MTEMTVNAHVDQLLARMPDKALFRFLDEQRQVAAELTLPTLELAARRIASALLERVPAGSPVMLLAGFGPEHLMGLLGCWRASTTAIPVYPPQGPQADAIRGAVVRVATASRAPVLLGLRAHLDSVCPALQQALGDHAPHAIAIDELAGQALAGSWPEVRPDQPAVMLFTSGSTGTPKGVVMTHRAICANLGAVALAKDCGPHDRVCSWMPQAHIAGLFLRVFPLITGCEAVLLPPSAFMASPLNWLQVMSDERCTITAAPDFAYALAAQTARQARQRDPAWSLRLDALKLAISGGESVRASTLQACLDVLGPLGLDERALHPYYGLTETMCSSIRQDTPLLTLALSRAGLAANRWHPPASEEDTIHFTGNGGVLGDTEIIAVDPGDSTPCAAGQVGELWIRGTAVTPGYAGLSREGAAWLGSLAGDDGAPFFRSGDLGFVHQGQVFVTGRLKELVIVRGKNHYPQDIEATALSVLRPAGVSQCAAFAVEVDDQEELGLALESAQPLEAGHIATLREALSRQHGLSVARLHVLPERALPRTPTHKVIRLQCARLSLSPEWQATLWSSPTASALAVPTQDTAGRLAQWQQWLSECLRRPVGLQELAQPISGLGLSSLHVARLIQEVATHWQVEMPVDRFFDRGNSLAWLDEAGTPADTRPAGLDWTSLTRQVLASLAAKQPLPPASKPGAAPNRILLTGATGFLGGELVHALLRHTDAVLLCHARAADEQAATDRVIQALQQGPGWHEAWRPRLQGITGPLHEARWGMSPDRWQSLAASVDAIVHNAADVNFVAPATALLDSNLLPLGPLLDLACQEGRLIPLHAVSTLAVFNDDQWRPGLTLTEERRVGDPAQVLSGYAQTKAAAELVLDQARDLGLPVICHRPGLVLGHSSLGRMHEADFLSRFIRACATLGCGPSSQTRLWSACVDQVADGIARTVAAGLHTGTFHWVHPEAPTVEQLLASIESVSGRPLSRLGIGPWQDHLRQPSLPAHDLSPVLPFVMQTVPGQDATLLACMDRHPRDVSTAASLPFMRSGISGSWLPPAQSLAAMVRELLRPQA